MFLTQTLEIRPMETEAQPPSNAQKRSRADFEDENANQIKPDGDSVPNDGIYNCEAVP